MECARDKTFGKREYLCDYDFHFFSIFYFYTVRLKITLKSRNVQQTESVERYVSFLNLFIAILNVPVFVLFE